MRLIAQYNKEILGVKIIFYLSPWQDLLIIIAQVNNVLHE